MTEDRKAEGLLFQIEEALEEEYSWLTAAMRSCVIADLLGEIRDDDLYINNWGEREPIPESRSDIFLTALENSLQHNKEDFKQLIKESLIEQEKYEILEQLKHLL